MKSPSRTLLGLGVLIFIATACRHPASTAVVPTETSELVVTSQFSSAVAAAQAAAVESHLAIERQVQLSDGTWMIVAHPVSAGAEIGSVALELKETGADDVTIRITQRISGTDSVADRRQFRQRVLDAIATRIRRS